MYAKGLPITRLTCIEKYIEKEKLLKLKTKPLSLSKKVKPSLILAEHSF